MKERSFTRCTVLAPTPRALAMANMPLPAVIDCDSFFQGGVDLRAPELFARPQRLIREDLHAAAPSGAPTGRFGGLDTVQRFA